MLNQPGQRADTLFRIPPDGPQVRPLLGRVRTVPLHLNMQRAGGLAGVGKPHARLPLIPTEGEPAHPAFPVPTGEGPGSNALWRQPEP